MKKHTLEWVERFFKEQGCELLEREYKNTSTPMRYKCNCGNISKIRYSNFRNGQRCMKCNGSERYSLEYIDRFFEERGCKLLGRYISAHTPVEYRCSCGNLSKISFTHFRKGHRCRKCGNKKTQEGLSHNYEDVKEYFLNNDCELLEETYINNRLLMEYKCSCGNISKISFDSFKRGHRCIKCSGNEKLTYEYVFNHFKEEGCILLEKEYVNTQYKMKYKCSCGNISEITFGNFKKGKRCRKCGNAKLSGKNNYKWIEDRLIVKENKQFRGKCQRMIRSFYRYTNKTKTNKTAKLLGYTVNELKKYIHNHPNWKNVDKNDFHLDHIFPIKAFLDYNIKDLKLINGLDNLQPLSEHDNLSKNCKYNKEKFENWLKSKGHRI